MGSFSNINVLITGGTRGIGKAIALRLAREGANIAIVGKTAEPNPKLEGTIFTAAEEIAAAGVAGAKARAAAGEGTGTGAGKETGAAGAESGTAAGERTLTGAGGYTGTGAGDGTRATAGEETGMSAGENARAAAGERTRTAAGGYTGTGAPIVVPIQGDIRFEESIKHIAEETVRGLGGIDILINNASAISLTPTEQTESKRWDLMHGINVRGTFLMSQACIPYLKKAHNPHILNMSPPLNMDPRWFAPHLAYTMSKYGMSMIVLGLAEELKQYRIAVNALWPKTTIATAAVQNLLGGDFLMQRSRKPEIVADAAAYILQKPSFETTGNFFIDEDVLSGEGITDLTSYAINPEQKLMNDLFL